MDGVYRKFRGTVKFNINKLIKWSLMAVPFLIGAILIWLIIKYDGMTYGLWLGCAISFAIIHIMHTIFYFFEPKYYAKRRKKYLPMWIATGVTSLISNFVLLTYESIIVLFFGPLLVVSFIGGAIKIEYSVRKYLIDIEDHSSGRHSRDD